MALTFFFACSAQSDALKNSDIFADFTGFADDRSHTVINEEVLSYPCAWMYFDSCEKTGDLGNQPGNKRNAQHPNKVGNPMQKECVQTGIKGQFPPTGRRISI